MSHPMSTSIEPFTSSLPTLNSSSSSSNNFSMASMTTPWDIKLSYYIIGSVGVSLNSFVAGIFIAFGNLWQKHGTVSSSNFHIFSQACVDNGVALLLILNTHIEDDGSIKYTKGNFFHELLCRLWHTKIIQVVVLYISICSVLILNFERYLAVVHPIFHKAKFVQTRKYSLCIFLAAVVIGIAYEIPFAVLTSKITEDGTCSMFSINMSKSFKQTVGLLSFSFEYLVPMLVTIFLYSSMAVKLHHKIEPRNGEHSAQSDSTFDMTRARNNVLKTSLLLSVLFIVCWSPYQFCRILYSFGRISLLGVADIFNIAVCLMYMNCCLNPCVYFFKYKPFQNYVKQFLTKLKSFLMVIRVTPCCERVRQ